MSASKLLERRPNRYQHHEQQQLPLDNNNQNIYQQSRQQQQQYVFHQQRQHHHHHLLQQQQQQQQPTTSKTLFFRIFVIVCVGVVSFVIVSNLYVTYINDKKVILLNYYNISSTLSSSTTDTIVALEKSSSSSSSIANTNNPDNAGRRVSETIGVDSGRKPSVIEKDSTIELSATQKRTTDTSSAVNELDMNKETILIDSTEMIETRGSDRTTGGSGSSSNSNNSSTAIDAATANGAFVHIGKTGGSTLASLLRNGCHSFIPKPCHTIPPNEESLASILIKSYYHVPDFSSLQHKRHNFYIITTRDPYERTVSAFTYEHLFNRKVRGDDTIEIYDVFKLQKLEKAWVCFPTLQIFVNYLKGNSKQYNYTKHKSNVDPSSCIDLAKAAIHGQVKIYNHFYFGYKRILSFFRTRMMKEVEENEKEHGRKKESNNNNKNSTIDNTLVLYITRQDNLWDDWSTINNQYLSLLDSTNTFNRKPVYIPPQDTLAASKRNLTALSLYLLTNATTTTANQLSSNATNTTTNSALPSVFPVTRDIDSNGTMYLCSALRDEYIAYFWFLEHSKNLNRTDIINAKRKSYTNCPNIIQEQSDNKFTIKQEVE